MESKVEEGCFFLSTAISDAFKSGLFPERAKLEVYKELVFWRDQYKKLRITHDPIRAAYIYQQEVDRSMEAYKKGKYGPQIKCAKGCSFCCYQHVSVSQDEAMLIREFLEEDKVSYNEQLMKAQLGKGEHEYKTLAFKDKRCMFLNDKGECGIYEVRPCACRKHVVLSDPKECSVEEFPDGLVLKGLDVTSELITSGMYNATSGGSMADMVHKALQEKPINNNQ